MIECCMNCIYYKPFRPIIYQPYHVKYCCVAHADESNGFVQQVQWSSICGRFTPKFTPKEDKNK